MIDVITTIDELNKVIDKLDNAKSSTDVNVLVSGIEGSSFNNGLPLESKNEPLSFSGCNGVSSDWSGPNVCLKFK